MIQRQPTLSAVGENQPSVNLCETLGFGGKGGSLDHTASGDLREEEAPDTHWTPEDSPVGAHRKVTLALDFY